MGRAFEYRKASKLKRWGAMSRIFPRLGRSITMAAKEGGTDPESNAKLRTAILNAKAENMPKDNIDAAIKRANAKDLADMKEVNYEGKGPHGALIFVETATDNATRTVANVKSHFKKGGGEMLNNGSLEFMFSRKAVFEFEKTEDMDLEELELELIDAGLEEIEEEDGTVLVTAEFTDFGTLSQAFEELKIDLKTATLKRFANTPIELSEEQINDIANLIERIEEDEDVQAVYTNFS
ncbi:YebC/PmpR family DNA-binding transcriptional regulator [Sulfurospirillum arcachonense]|uniref:YebC/PmpR family DNA-binding transcriptional regulator n=1 Tax=Sulfurospirillum arcachonense TaxID=57666 RepID=UPI000469BFFF|nr:YebC/PmpR family DNA-binding transcriptional regulator [Sulfurospirillum arcachonense]